MALHKIFVAIISGFSLSTAVFADIEAGKLALEEGKFSAAVEFFELDIEGASTAFDANWLTGKAYVSMGDVDSALPFLEKAIKLEPDHADALYWWGVANGEKAGQASIFSAAGYAKACRQAFEKTLVIDPSHVDARMGLVEYYLSAPGIMGGDKDKALIEAQKILELDKSLGYAAIASVQLAKEDIEAAMSTYDTAIAEFPEDMGLLFSRGMLQRAFERYEAALLDFDTLLTVEVERQKDVRKARMQHSLGQYFYGAVSVQSGLRKDEGIKLLEDFLHKGVFDHPVREGFGQYYLAKLYLEKGNRDRATELLVAAEKYKDNKDLRKLVKKLKKQLTT